MPKELTDNEKYEIVEGLFKAYNAILKENKKKHPSKGKISERLVH